MIITARWKGGITNDKKYFSEKVQEKVLTNIKNCQFNNQTTRQPNNNTERFGWKLIPSVARVTRDEVSGLQIIRGDCLEDSTKHSDSNQTSKQQDWMKNWSEIIKNDNEKYRKTYKKHYFGFFLSLWGAKKVNKSYIV